MVHSDPDADEQIGRSVQRECTCLVFGWSFYHLSAASAEEEASTSKVGSGKF